MVTAAAVDMWSLPPSKENAWFLSCVEGLMDWTLMIFNGQQIMDWESQETSKVGALQRLPRAFPCDNSFL